MSSLTRRVLLFMIATLGLAIAHAPASLLDAALARASSDGLRLTGVEGSLWHGSGMVTGRSADGRSGLPLQPLGWHFEPQALASGALQWSVLSGQHDTRQSGGIAQRSTATLRVGLAGLRIEHLAVHGPVEAVLAPIPHVLAHAGWSGDFGLSVTRWDCPLYGPCSGELTLLWRGARSTLLPGQPFGDYTLHLSADRGDLRYRIHTLAGRVVVEGGGKAGRGLAPDFSASLKGDPTLLDRLPALAGGIVRPTAEAGRFDVSWPAR